MPCQALVSQPTPRFAVLSFGADPDDRPQIITTKNNKKKRIFLDIDEPYTRTIIHQALISRGFAVTLGPGHGMDAVRMPADCHFQWSEYERIDWMMMNDDEHDDSNSNSSSNGRRTIAASSYRIRKGLSRKAQLALYTNRHVSKHPNSILKQAIPETVILDTWAAFETEGTSSTSACRGLADAVVASAATAGTINNINLRQRLEHCLQAGKELLQRHADDENDDAVWILKGSTVNKGVGIYIVHVPEQLVDICWSESNIREWVLQRYISSPLLLGKRKFHIRAYIVAVGALRVYFCNDCLALLSGTAYRPRDFERMTAHITNTAYQDIDPGFREQDCILQWGSDRVLNMLVRGKTCTDNEEAVTRVNQVLVDMQDIVAELFRAYETEFGVFSPIEDCFEHYGLDFVIDSKWQVYLLEVNPGPGKLEECS
jgi:tubulin--tyrosine ligase